MNSLDDLYFISSITSSLPFRTSSKYEVISLTSSLRTISLYAYDKKVSFLTAVSPKLGNTSDI